MGKGLNINLLKNAVLAANGLAQPMPGLTNNIKGGLGSSLTQQTNPYQNTSFGSLYSQLTAPGFTSNNIGNAVPNQVVRTAQTAGNGV